MQEPSAAPWRPTYIGLHGCPYHLVAAGLHRTAIDLVKLNLNWSDSCSPSPECVLIMPRGPYITVSPKDHERILNAYNKNSQDGQLLDQQLGIKRQTAGNLIRLYQREHREHALPKGGNRPRLLGDDMLQYLIQFVGAKPTATLGEMRAKLLNQFPDVPPVSQSTISRARLIVS